MTPSVDQALMRLLHGEMPPQEAAALRERMDREPALAAAYERLERSWRALSLPPSPGVPPGFSGRVMARIADLPRPGSNTFRTAPLWVRAAAAVCLIVGTALGASVGGLWSSRGSTASATEIFGAIPEEDSESLNESYWGEVASATLKDSSQEGALPDGPGGERSDATGGEAPL